MIKPDHSASPHLVDQQATPSRWRALLVGVSKQVAQLIGVLLAVSLLTFLILNALPGSVVNARIGPLQGFSPEERQAVVDNLTRELGLDRPLVVQYFIWLQKVVTGDLGLTYQGIQVSSLISDRAVATVQLAVASLAISTVGAFAVALLSHRTRWRVLRGGIQGGFVLLLVFPPFWIGLLLVISFAVELRWLPSAGYVPFSSSPIDNLRYLILPAVTLALPQMALFYRYLSAGLRDVSTAPFVTAARARGLSNRAVDYRHVLPNAILPTITIIGLVAGSLISGLVIVESVFSWPGLGLLLVRSARQSDYNTVAAIVLVTAFTYVLIAFAVDLLYRVIDPRTRRGSA